MRHGGSKRQCSGQSINSRGKSGVPVHVAENMKRVQKTARELQQSLGRDATPKEIAEKLGDKSEDDVKNIINYLQNPVSLETPVGDDGENSLGDMVEDRSGDTPEEAMNALVQKEEVKELLEKFKRQRTGSHPVAIRSGGRKNSHTRGNRRKTRSDERAGKTD